MMNKISDMNIAARNYHLMKWKIVDVIVEMQEQNRFSKHIFDWIGFHTYKDHIIL